MADDKKPLIKVDPDKFITQRFGAGDLYTRSRRGLIEDDMPPILGVQPGPYGPHAKEEPDDTNAYNKGGMVKHGSSTRVSCKSKG